MFRTLYEKSSGTIISCVNLSDIKLAEYLSNHPQHDAIDLYTKGVKDIAVDTVTKKLKKLTPVVQDPIAVIRLKRMTLLASCDWTQAADSPLNETKRNAWAVYRQQLRDMPDTFANVNSINDVVWPTPPQ